MSTNTAILLKPDIIIKYSETLSLFECDSTTARTNLLLFVQFKSQIQNAAENIQFTCGK
jgi:hypothetical protein